MQIEKEEHRQFLMELIKQSNIPGQLLDLACEVKQAIKGAAVVPPPKDGE